VTGESYPNGVQAAYTYDAAGDLTGILDTHSAAALASYAYQYNATTC